jgi:hypothetical protein
MSSKDQAVKQDAAAQPITTRQGKKLLELPRRISANLRKCSTHHCADTLPENVKYLWATFRADEDGALDVQEWLNVVDEAASLGLEFIVFSVEGRLHQQDTLWQVCKWAQDVYGLHVGVHVYHGDLGEDEIAAFKQLDLKSARLFVGKEYIESLRFLEEEGVALRVADPAGSARANPAPCCDLPRQMLYVDSKGIMYTCKYVQDNSDYRIGHFCSRTFKNVVDDPSRPAVVPEDAPERAHGCDGCPPVVNNF